MGRLRRERARKKLAQLLGRAQDENFFLLAWAVHALQTGRSDTAARYITFPPEAKTSDLDSRFAVYPWVLETLLNEILIAPKPRAIAGQRSINLDCSKFEAIAAAKNLLDDVENAEAGIILQKMHILRELHRVGHRQFEWQRGLVTYWQLYRAAFLYRGPLTLDFFKTKLGFTVDEMSLACFSLRAFFQRFPVLQLGRGISGLEAVGLTGEALRRILGHLSISLRLARDNAARLRAHGDHTGYKPSLFRQYPLVSVGLSNDQMLGPIPDLIVLRGTSGLFYDTVKADDRVKNEIADRFELYSAELFERLLPFRKICKATEYRFNRQVIQTPDICIEDGGSISAIVECKATRMNFQARFSEDPLTDAGQGYNEIVKAVFQIWRAISHIRQGFLSGKKTRAKVTGIVLTLDPWMSMFDQAPKILEAARRLATEKDNSISSDDQIPIIFCPINELEYALIHTTDEAFETLVYAAATDVQYGGWLLSSVRGHLFPEALARDFPFRDCIPAVLPWLSQIESMVQPG